MKIAYSVFAVLVVAAFAVAAMSDDYVMWSTRRRQLRAQRIARYFGQIAIDAEREYNARLDSRAW